MTSIILGAVLGTAIGNLGGHAGWSLRATLFTVVVAVIPVIVFCWWFELP